MVAEVHGGRFLLRNASLVTADGSLLCSNPSLINRDAPYFLRRWSCLVAS